MANPVPCPEFNQIYFLMNTVTCGYCRKFAPVLESNLNAMRSCARSACTVAHANTPEGQAVFEKLRYKGGIPCVVAVRPDGEVIATERGYKDTKSLGPLLAQLMMA